MQAIMNLRKKHRVIIGMTLFVVMLALLIAFFVGRVAANRAADEEYFTILGHHRLLWFERQADYIPSMMSVVGHRNIRRASVNARRIVLEYTNIEDVAGDIAEYIAHLGSFDINGSLFPTQYFDLSQPNGTIQLARNSVTFGYVIVVDINFSQNGYVVVIEKVPGRITPEQDHGLIGSWDGGWLSFNTGGFSGNWVVTALRFNRDGTVTFRHGGQGGGSWQLVAENRVRITAYGSRNNIVRDFYFEFYEDDGDAVVFSSAHGGAGGSTLRRES